MEIQVNDGSVMDKVKFTHGLFEKPISVDTVFDQDEIIDAIAVMKGHGFEDVKHHWHMKKPPQEIHRDRLRRLTQR